MSSIIDKERELYEDAWAIENYAQHSPGETYLPMFLDMAGIPADKQFPGSVLDAGCGSGKGALALKARGFYVTMCDITRAGLVKEAQSIAFREAVLWDDLRKFGEWHDYVYCTDVLEHIPTPLTMLTVSRLTAICRKGVFLSVALQADKFGAWVGQPLHQTVQPFTWWRDHLASVAYVKSLRDCLGNGMFYLEPR